MAKIIPIKPTQIKSNTSEVKTLQSVQKELQQLLKLIDQKTKTCPTS